MDSDDERTAKRPRTSLTQLFNEVPARESIPNSCSEESSDDDEELLPLPINRGTAEKKMPSWMADRSSGRPAPAASNGLARPRPGMSKGLPSNVQTTPGYGGKIVYSVSTDKGAASFYCMQW
jgi:hypothetical protein